MPYSHTSFNFLASECRTPILPLTFNLQSAALWYFLSFYLQACGHFALRCPLSSGMRVSSVGAYSPIALSRTHVFAEKKFGIVTFMGCKVTIHKSLFVPCTDAVCPWHRYGLYRERSAIVLSANRIGCGILSHLQRSI